MIFVKKQDKIVFNKEHAQICVNFSSQKDTLQIEAKLRNTFSIFSTILTSQSYLLHYELSHYFPSLSALFRFLSTLHEGYISVSAVGVIQLRIFAEELEERSIEIHLKKQGEAELFSRLEQLEQSRVEESKSKDQEESMMSSLREELARMTTVYNDSLLLLSSKIEQLTHSLQAKQQADFISTHKHHLINTHQGRIFNDSMDYEVRWALLGPCISTQNSTLLRFKIHKLDWLALGFCHKKHIESRKYRGFNGIGEHGAYVMDSCGWVYSHAHSSTNYQRLGFNLAEGDTISLIYTPREATVTFINHSSWEKYDLSLRQPQEQLFPCFACSRQTELEIMHSPK